MMNLKNNCPVCNEGQLIDGVEDNAVEYKGVRKVLPFRFSACSKCLVEQTSYEQAQWNKLQMTEFRKKVNEGGVVQKRPYAQKNAQRRSIYTDDETWAKLKTMGKGSASAGIREAVRQAQENNNDH